MPHVNPGMINSQGAAAFLVVLPLPAIQEEQSACVWGGEGCHGWGDALNQSILLWVEGRWALVSSLLRLPHGRGTQSSVFQRMLKPLSAGGTQKPNSAARVSKRLCQNADQEGIYVAGAYTQEKYQAQVFSAGWDLMWQGATSSGALSCVCHAPKCSQGRPMSLCQPSLSPPSCPP